MAATKAIVTSEFQRAERRSRWGMFRIFARRSDGTGPHFLPNAQNANISGGAFTQVVGPTIIQQYNIGGSVPNTQTSSATVNSPTFRDTAEPTYGANGERLQSTNVTVPANQTPPSRRPQDTYQDLLEREGYGFPFWVSSPSRGLQAEYRYEGVSIGDVGVFASNGGFDYLFNICLPADDPRNSRRLPPNFQPLYPPLASLDVMEHDQFSPRACVVSRDIRINDGDVSLISRTSTTFVNHGPEGAVLVMPQGASEKVVINDSRFAEYLTAERIVSFYEFVNDTQDGLGRRIGNGQLRVVYGSTKGIAFAMASIPPSAPSEPPTRLQFNETDERSRTTESASSVSGAFPTSQDRYFWNFSGRAQVKVGPGAKDQMGLDRSRVATGLENQCLFVRALDLHLSQETWDRQQLSNSGIVASGAAHQGKPNKASEAGSLENPSSGSASTSTHLGGDGASSDSNNTDREVIQLELRPHPSTVLKQYAFQKYPHAKAVILSDRDWLYLTESNKNIPSPSETHYDIVDTTKLRVSGHELEVDMTKNMLDLVDQELQDGVISFKPRDTNAKFASHIQSLAERFDTMEDVKTYLFGRGGSNRRDAVARIVETILPEYNQTFWQSIVGRSRRLERDASFTSKLHAHPWAPISLLELLEAKNLKTLFYFSPDIVDLKNTCLLPTGKSNLINISILAHRLQERFRKSGQIEDLHEAIFYYKHVIGEHDTIEETFQQAHESSDVHFSTSFWTYPTVLIGLSAALHIRLQIQKRRSDYQLLLDCLEKQKQLDLLFLGVGQSTTQDKPFGSSSPEHSLSTLLTPTTTQQSRPDEIPGINPRNSPTARSNVPVDLSMANQMAFHFYTKLFFVLNDARATEEPKTSGKVDKWFNLETLDSDLFTREAREPYRTLSTSNPRPLELQILLKLPEMLDNHTIMYTPADRPRVKIERSKRYILLEQWTMQMDSTVPIEAAGLNALPVIYKHGIIFFRSLFSLLRVLPAWKLHERLCHKDGAGGMSMELRVRNEIPEEQILTFGEPAPHPLPTATHDFTPVPQPFGAFILRGAYLADPTFEVDEFRRLPSARSMPLYKQVFIPTLDDILQRDSISELEASSVKDTSSIPASGSDVSSSAPGSGSGCAGSGQWNAVAFGYEKTPAGTGSQRDRRLGATQGRRIGSPSYLNTDMDDDDISIFVQDIDARETLSGRERELEPRDQEQDTDRWSLQETHGLRDKGYFGDGPYTPSLPYEGHPLDLIPTPSTKQTRNEATGFHASSSPTAGGPTRTSQQEVDERLRKINETFFKSPEIIGNSKPPSTEKRTAPSREAPMDSTNRG